MFSKVKTEYEVFYTRVLSQVKFRKGKFIRIYWIETFSYDTNVWEKLREIEPIPEGAEIKSLYEEGNGYYVPPFWDRVAEKMDIIQKDYYVLDIYDKFEPCHFAGKNVFGRNIYKGDTLQRIMILKRKGALL